MPLSRDRSQAGVQVFVDREFQRGPRGASRAVSPVATGTRERQAAASRAEGASPRARVPPMDYPMDYADKLPPRPLCFFCSAALAHELAAVDTMRLENPETGEPMIFDVEIAVDLARALAADLDRVARDLSR